MSLLRRFALLLLTCTLSTGALAASNRLNGISVTANADGTAAVVLDLDRPIKDVGAFSTGVPARIVIDLPDTGSRAVARQKIDGKPPVLAVSAVEVDGKTRVVIEADRAAEYRTRSVGKTLVVTVGSKLVASPSLVTAIDFSKTDASTGRLVVRFDGPAGNANVSQNGKDVLIDIPNAGLLRDLIGQVDIRDLGTAGVSVNREAIDGAVRITLKTDGSAQMSSFQTGRDAVIEIKTQVPAVVSKPAAKPAAKPAGKAETLAAEPAAKPALVSSHKAMPGYTGKPLTFNFQDVPVRTILQLIADESQLNIVVADTVDGSLTLRLINVPWDQALDIVLRAKGLDKRRDGNVVWVGGQNELAQYEQSREDARIAIENREETVSEYIAVNYGSAETIAKLLTDDSKSGTAGGATSGQQRGFLSPRGSVSFDARTNTLLLIDIPKKITEVKRLLETLDRPVDQVMIEARIVVAQDSFGRELGAKFGVNDRYDVDPGNPGVTRGGGFNVNLPTSNPAGILNFSILGANTSLDIELQAMETKGKGEVVSNPRIITSNQKAAIIRQGDEVGYVTTQASGTSTVPQATVQFKEVLLELKVTPTITQDGRVFLDLGVKKDEIKDFLSTPTGDIPQIQKREVNTAVLVGDGQTVVIGGVYEFKDREDASKVPFLGDVPFLGALFKRSDRSQEKAELLIFVTPKIIKAARSDVTAR